MSARSILDIVGCLFLLMFALQVFTTVRAHRGLSGRAIRYMSRVSLGGVKSLLLIGGLVGLMSAIFQPLFMEWIPPLPPFLIIGVSLLALNGACLPPTFLFLAASREGGVSLASELQFTVAPLKIVHLLDSFQAGPIVGDSLHHSEYRVSSDWQRAVRILSGISPVIIVDIRDLTPNVYREVAHLVKARLHSKTFLIAESAQAPAEVSRLCNQYGVRICVVTPQLLKLALNRIGWTVLSQPVGNIYRFLELRMLSLVEGNLM